MHKNCVAYKIVANQSDKILKNVVFMLEKSCNKENACLNIILKYSDESVTKIEKVIIFTTLTEVVMKIIIDTLYW